MSSTSYWQADLANAYPSQLMTDPLRGTRATDVAIVGAGVTGAATALWLARAGARMRVLEARQVAAGASGRNAGFIASGTTEPYATAIARYGRGHAKRIWGFSADNAELVATLNEEMAALGWSSGAGATRLLLPSIAAMRLLLLVFNNTWIPLCARQCAFPQYVLSRAGRASWPFQEITCHSSGRCTASHAVISAVVIPVTAMPMRFGPPR